MPDIDVSFIISLYKPNLLFLREMVESVVDCCRQATDVKCEIVLSSDGSPDDAALEVEKYAEMYPDLVVGCNSSVNRGVGAARCALVEKSRGRYIASFDQDDILLPFDLAGKVKFLDEHREYAASYAPKFLFDENGLTGTTHGGKISRFTAFFSPKININAMLIRREELIAHQSFMPCPGSPINDDVYLMMRLQYDRDLYFDTDPRCLYRCHPQQNRFSSKDEDFLVMGNAMIAKDPELYQAILDGKDPQETPENFRAVQGYYGLAFFLNQNKNRGLANKIAERAVKFHPEDFGAWESLLVSRFNQLDFRDTFAEACQRFENDLEALLTFYSWMFVFYEKKHLQMPPDFRKRYLEMRKVFYAAPEIVRDNLPRSVTEKKRPNYVFVAPKLKI